MADLFEAPTSMPQIINSLSSLLQQMTESNDLPLSSQPEKMSVFYGLCPPSISIQSYLERIFKYANCSNSCFVVAYVYLDRFSQRQPFLSINSFNVHRLLITSVMVAAKFMDDMYYNNAYYARIGGISTIEMNFLEVEFLFGLGFHLNLTPEVFDIYSLYLERQMLLVQPPLNVTNFEPNSSLIKAKSVSLIHSYYHEDESSSRHHHQQHRQRQHQQLAV